MPTNNSKTAMTNRCDVIHRESSNNDSRSNRRTIINSDNIQINNCRDEQTEQDRQIHHHRKQNQSIISSHRSSNKNNASISLGSATAKTIKTTEEHTSVVIPSRRKRRYRRRHTSFFNDDITSPIKKDTTGDTLSCNVKISMAKNEKESPVTVDITGNMPSSFKDVTALTYQRKSPTSVVLEPQQSQRLHNGEEEDVITTSTMQTMHTGMSTYLSNSDASPVESSSSSMSSPTSRPVMIIETELSNLTESQASDTDQMDHAMNIHSMDAISSRNGVTPSDQLQSSMIRLHELELKRNVLRHQRFNLEQRLYNFCSSSPSFMGRSKQPMDAIISQHSTQQQQQQQQQRISLPVPLEEEEEEESSHQKKVINWRYSTDANPYAEAMILQSPALPPQTVIYTGYLNDTGRPHDDDGILQFADGQIYRGSVREGQRHGWGTNKWPDNGQTYSGEWSHNSRCGMGTHTWKDKTVTGMWKDGHLHGQVYFQWDNGAVYDGNAVNGKKEGRGVSTLSDGSVHNGHFAKGKEEGFGTLIRPDGAKYRGQFRKGLKDGYGIMLWKDRTYDGQWIKGKPHGQGRVVWSNGTVFTGEFQQGKYDGLGVYIWPSGKKFVGRWQHGIKTGHGLYTWPSGKKYDGEYRDGLKDGYGRMSWADGSTYCGGFKRDQQCGRGVQIDADGQVIHCGLWKNGRPYHGDDESEASVRTLLMPNPMHERICI